VAPDKKTANHGTKRLAVLHRLGAENKMFSVKIRMRDVQLHFTCKQRKVNSNTGGEKKTISELRTNSYSNMKTQEVYSSYQDL
jgi:hypothetical protein